MRSLSLPPSSPPKKKKKVKDEMLVGPIKALFMDGISIGLDCLTTLQIVNLLE